MVGLLEAAITPAAICGEFIDQSHKMGRKPIARSIGMAMKDKKTLGKLLKT
jgi:hypothetical protein